MPQSDWPHAKKKMVMWLIIIAAIVGLFIIPWQFTESTKNLLRQQTKEVSKIARKNSLDSCKRGNKLRSEVSLNKNVLKTLLDIAADAREQQAIEEANTNPAQAKLDLAIAKKYRALAAKLHKTKMVNCNQVIK